MGNLGWDTHELRGQALEKPGRPGAEEGRLATQETEEVQAPFRQALLFTRETLGIQTV